MARDEVSTQPDADRPAGATDPQSPLHLPPLQLPPLAGKAGMGAAESRPWGKLNDDVWRYRDSGDDAPRQIGLELQQSQSASDGDGISRGDTGRSLRAATEYKVYKRRFFGLAQLCLLNIVVSWDWLTFAPVSAHSASYFGTDENAINWLSIAFFFAFLPAAPAVIYTLHRGPKLSIMVCAGLVLCGNWIRYGGAKSNNFGVVMFGQILTGLAQPFVLAAPTRYSDMWFTSRGRVAATALTSLANPLGAALGQLIVPMWVMGPQDVPNAVLYVAVISTLSALPSFFIPASPPTPAAPSSETPKTSLRATVHALTSCLEFWLVAIPFAVYVGLFNSISSLLPQIMTPYGYSVDEAGIAGAVLIVVGLVASAISSPIIDRTKLFLPAIKIAVPIISLAYLAFIFMPATRDGGGLAGPYVVLAILGAASFSLLPVAVELSVEFTHPVSPEVTSTVAWAAGQLMGGAVLLISGAVRAGSGASPPFNMNQALIFHAVVALLAMPLPLALGLFGRDKMVELKRVKSDRASLTAHAGPA